MFARNMEKQKNKVIHFEKYGNVRRENKVFPQKNKDLFNYEKNKEVYIKNKVMYIFLSKK